MSESLTHIYLIHHELPMTYEDWGRLYDDETVLAANPLRMRGVEYCSFVQTQKTAQPYLSKCSHYMPEKKTREVWSFWAPP